MAASISARNIRLGAEWDDGKELAARLSAILGRPLSMTEYVRQALARENARVREIVTAEEIPAGSAIIVTRAGLDIGGGRILTRPGAYRIAGTTELIRIEDDTEDDVRAALND